MSPLTNWTRPVAGLVILAGSFAQEHVTHALLPKHIHVEAPEADRAVLQRHVLPDYATTDSYDIVLPTGKDDLAALGIHIGHPTLDS